MGKADLALTGDEALELLAFLLSSARSCLYDPPGYGTYRLATAAERLSRAWEPRTRDGLCAYLHELSDQVEAHEWDPMGRSVETEGLLDELLATLARVARDDHGAPGA